MILQPESPDFYRNPTLERLAVRGLVVMVLATWALAAVAVEGQTVPTPESVLGHKVGEDFFLATYEESIDYFHRLDAASDRVRLERVGTTSQGRDWYIAFVSSAANLARLDSIRETAQRLAHPEGLDDAAARALARDGRAIVHIDGGLHATEVAHAQHTMQLAYDLASETADPELLRILDNVVLLLWPSINPDGQTMVAEWYRSNLGTPFEVSSLPELYQDYIGHDNNRDGYMLNMLESRVVTRVTREWEPQILYNHHQSSPFPTRIWIPPFAEPISEFVHPLMWRTVNLIGMSMAQALEERGQRGAVHMGTGFDNWYPGFIDHANNFHNVASLLTETALYRYATPHFYTLADFPRDRRDLRPQSLYSSPWQGGWWKLRDAVDYMLTASISVLDIAAKYKEDLLYNRYQAGRDVTEYHRNNPPFAYFVPQAQRDPVAAVELLRRLAFNGIDIQRLREAVVAEGQPFPSGTWVIAMDQPFANFVRQLFAAQSYPDLREYPEGPPDQPYDIAGWTLPYQMDVRVVEAREPLSEAVRAALEPVAGAVADWKADRGARGADAAGFDSVPGAGFDTQAIAAGILPPEGRVSGSGPALILDPAQNNTFRALARAWKAGATVSFRTGTPAGATGSTSGNYTVSGLADGAASSLVSELRLQATRGPAAGTRLERPRLALYRPWTASVDEGWTRFLLEAYEIGFENVRDAEIRAGGLHSRFDVLLLADISRREITEGFATGTVPARYAGGLGREGARAIEEFVRTGGTLVTINDSSLYAIDELHLAVENVVEETARAEFFLGGSIVEVIVDPSHPVMSGMPERAKVMAGPSPVFTTKEGFVGTAIARYQTEGTPLISGYLLGEKHLQGFAAALDVRHGAGRVVLLGFRPQWRGQPFGTFRVLFNACLYGAQLAAATPPNPDFWKPPKKEEQKKEEEKKDQEEKPVKKETETEPDGDRGR